MRSPPSWFLWMCGVAALIVLPWLLRPALRLEITAAEPGSVVAFTGRTRVDGRLSEVRSYTTPAILRLPRRGSFEAELVAAEPEQQLAAAFTRSIPVAAPSVRLVGACVRMHAEEGAFHSGAGGFSCGESTRPVAGVPVSDRPADRPGLQPPAHNP